MRKFAVVILLFVALPAAAEVYKWTDAEGRVHFGDKPKDAKVAAEAVDVRDYKPGTDDGVRQINERRERLMDAGKPSPADARREKFVNAVEDAAKARACREAKDRLMRIRGPVVFLDDDGKPVKVTERGREQKAKEQEAWIQANCR